MLASVHQSTTKLRGASRTLEKGWGMILERAGVGFWKGLGKGKFIFVMLDPHLIVYDGQVNAPLIFYTNTLQYICMENSTEYI